MVSVKVPRREVGRAVRERALPARAELRRVDREWNRLTFLSRLRLRRLGLTVETDEAVAEEVAGESRVLTRSARRYRPRPGADVFPERRARAAAALVERCERGTPRGPLPAGWVASLTETEASLGLDPEAERGAETQLAVMLAMEPGLRQDDPDVRTRAMRETWGTRPDLRAAVESYADAVDARLGELSEREQELIGELERRRSRWEGAVFGRALRKGIRVSYDRTREIYDGYHDPSLASGDSYFYEDRILGDYDRTRSDRLRTRTHLRDRHRRAVKRALSDPRQSTIFDDYDDFESIPF